MSVMIIVGKCCDCGKQTHTGYSVRTKDGFKQVPRNFRSFNDGKITRCLECCEKQGIAEISLKDVPNKYFN